MEPTSRATKRMFQDSLAVSQPPKEARIPATNIDGLVRSKSPSEKTERTYVLCLPIHDFPLTQPRAKTPVQACREDGSHPG